MIRREWLARNKNTLLVLFTTLLTFVIITIIFTVNNRTVKCATISPLFMGYLLVIYIGNSCCLPQLTRVATSSSSLVGVYHIHNDENL